MSKPEPGGRAGLRRRRVGVQGGNGNEPAVREDDGPVGVLRDQDFAPGTAGGSNPAASAASVVANHTSATVRP